MTVDVKESDASAASWERRDFIGETLRLAVAAADILMVPYEGYGPDHTNLRYFPSGSAELFDSLRRGGPPRSLL